MSGLDFPKTQIEFQKIFNNETACRNCLMKIRWTDGYRCPSCSYDKYWMLKTNLLECCSCGHQTSLTAGT
ncbi:transposase, partial [bacterium]|nr:transposase [bacterium]